MGDNKAMNDYREDFVEDNYRQLLNIAKKQYNFITYEQYREAGRCILWRHDLDCSVHRAFKVAMIEAQENIKTTFFLHLHSHFYNLLEKEIAGMIFQILDMGHKIGLHFDPSFYNIQFGQFDKFEEFLILEKQLLEKSFSCDINVFSMHDPDVGGWINYKAEMVANTINTYSQYIFDHYVYCSDSNGYWRYQRLEDVLINADSPKVQILTHPEWWVPDVLSPRDRITRCIDGRAAKQHKMYDALMAEMGRKNVR